MELQRQLQGATDENTKKQLQQEISITQAKRDVAEAKRVGYVCIDSRSLSDSQASSTQSCTSLWF